MQSDSSKLGGWTEGSDLNLKWLINSLLMKGVDGKTAKEYCQVIVMMLA